VQSVVLFNYGINMSYVIQKCLYKACSVHVSSSS